VHIETARQVKAELRGLLPGLLAAAQAAGRPAAVAVGLCPSRGGYGIAVRHSGVPQIAHEITRHARRLAGADCDIRDVGTVRPQQWTVEHLRSRVRPLHPGLSVAHAAVTAGTIGAFVRPVGDDGPVHLLSNNHVVANSDQAQLGDVRTDHSAPAAWPCDIFVAVRAGRARPDTPNFPSRNCKFLTWTLFVRYIRRLVVDRFLLPIVVGGGRYLYGYDGGF
jgi:hypothetical protein